MAEKKTLGSAKRFGVRYGRTVKKRLAAIEKEQKKKHKCPYCSKERVKRVFAGVWYCDNCETKFTSRAYTVSEKQLTIKKEKIIEVREELPEVEETETVEVEA